MNKPGEMEDLRRKIALWGIGDWGIRIVGSIQPEYRRQVNIVALDTDMQSLVCSPVSSKIAIGENTTGGLGTGGDIEKACRAFSESEEKVKAELRDCKVLLLVGGIGGGVGSGVIPLLCKYAGREKIFTMVFISRPFEFEGRKKNLCFQQAREKIEESVAGLACFSLDRLVGRAGDETLHDEVFHHCDRILKESVECVIAYLSSSTPRGGDYASLNNLLSHSGETVMGISEAGGSEDLTEAIKGAITALSLSASELGSARGFLVQIDSGGRTSIPTDREGDRLSLRVDRRRCRPALHHHPESRPGREGYCPHYCRRNPGEERRWDNFRYAGYSDHQGPPPPQADNI